LASDWSRWLNIVLGIAYTLIMLMVVSGSDWVFYTAIGLLEAVLTAWIAWSAWKWPRQKAA
jgi:hypothetical protein